MGRPRPRPKEHKPSPLSQTHFTSPPSVAPPEAKLEMEMGDVPDGAFWKRFSVAVHRSETDVSLESGVSTMVSSLYTKDEDQWLVQQRKEKRRCRIMCMSITLMVLLVIAGGAVVAWYFTQGPGQH